jgi:uncharacterized protein
MAPGMENAQSRQSGCAQLHPVNRASLWRLAGTSFKPEHLQAILAEKSSAHWFEVHAENYMMAGGPRLQALERLRRDYAISVHGVGLSIGAAQPLDELHLKRLGAVVNRFEPALVSEHLAWSTHGTTFYNDLLPLPYDAQSLANVCDHIDQVQEMLQRTLLLENPSTYVAFANSTMTETEFLRAVVRRTGCGLLLDINNVMVSATNRGYSPLDYLKTFPLDRVSEIHLAGHAQQVDDEGGLLLIDSHDRRVAESVWKLYEGVIGRQGPLPTLIEWDSQIPDWPTLEREAKLAQSTLDAAVPSATGHYAA